MNQSITSDPQLYALDYDGTITRDVDFWRDFIVKASERGHRVAIVTMRYPEEAARIDSRILEVCSWVIATSRKAKKPFLRTLGVHPDVWIDDQPEFLLHDAKLVPHDNLNVTNRHVAVTETKKLNPIQRRDPLFEVVLRRVNTYPDIRNIVFVRHGLNAEKLKQKLIAEGRNVHHWRLSDTISAFRDDKIEGFLSSANHVLILTAQTVALLGRRFEWSPSIKLHATFDVDARTWVQLQTYFPQLQGKSKSVLNSEE